MSVTNSHDHPVEGPPSCPGGRNGQKCLSLPLDPVEFGKFCYRNEVGIEEAVVMIPAWIFNSGGKKIGTRSYPWYGVSEKISFPRDMLIVLCLSGV